MGGHEVHESVCDRPKILDADCEHLCHQSAETDHLLPRGDFICSDAFGDAGKGLQAVSYTHLLARTGLDFTPVITHIISFDEAVKTIRNIDSLGSSRIKVMVKIDDQI